MADSSRTTENSSKVSESEIIGVISKHLDGQVSNLTAISTGQISEPYGFEVAGDSYVIRFARPGFSDTLHKDRYVSEALLSDVPVAKFIAVNELGDRTYAITRRAQGRILDEYSKQEYEQLIPDLIAVLDRIHQTKIDQKSSAHVLGWGDFDRYGVGRKPTLHNYLAAIEISPPLDDAGFFGDWHKLFETSYLDRELFYQGFELMQSRFGAIPEQRYLVHNDYGFDNVLAQDNQVTAVIDWANAVYGDFVMDIARLEFFMPEWHWADRFAEYYKAQARVVPHYRERIQCYCCFAALDGLRFYATTDQRAAYEVSAQRLRCYL